MSESYDAMWAESDYDWDEEAVAADPEPSTAEHSSDLPDFNSAFNSAFRETINDSWSRQWIAHYSFSGTASSTIHDSYYLTAPSSLAGTGATENNGTIADTYGAITRNEW